MATALCVLGPLEVVRDGEHVRLGSAQQRRLLAVLVTHANQVVSSDRLVDALWADDSSAGAAHTPETLVSRLQTLVSRLRTTLDDDRLETRPPGYRLRAASADVDALRFEELVRVALAASDQPEAALRGFDEALVLWRGSPYAEFSGEEFATAEVARLVELRARAIEERSAALLELGRPGEVIGELEGEIEAQPFRERLRALLMLALARAGRPVESLRAYDTFRRFLADEVGVVPSPTLQELNDDIVRQHPDVGWEASPTKRADAPELPSGTVTFLFTDVEGSTRLWEEHPDAMQGVMARHDEIVRDAVTAHDGHIVKDTGDGFHAVFATAHDALAAATAAQVALQREPSDTKVPFRVRMGVHTCEAELREGDYYGSAVNRAACLMSAAHGGQIVVSQATSELAHEAPVELVDLGEHRLPDLARPERVFQVVRPDLPAEFPRLRSLDAFSTNLPLQLTAFVGREDEVTEVVSALDSARVVTLTGIGGVGKTRVALQVAARVLSRYRDGAWFCELAPVGDPAVVVEAIATALGVGVREGQTVEESLEDFLRVKQVLVVLDNCEHLLDAVTEVVDRLVRACPRITVLATSREGLALRGERILALRSLGLPDVDASTDAAAAADAVRLFVERAADARTGFALHDDNVAAVVQICRRLDGIPLAIELAAARVPAMTPGEIATRLDDQFRLLRGGSRGAVERHQTLRHAMDWSYDLLTADERLVLERLSVFAGGAALDDVEAVAGNDTIAEFDVLEHLTALVRRSLVLADDHEGHTRYRLLETVRQYAHEHLELSGTADVAQRRHAEHYAELAVEAGPGLRNADQLAWIARLTPEIDNLRAAQAWAIDHQELDLALTIVIPLCVTGTTIGHSALGWASALATDPGVDTRPLGPALLAQASFHAAVGANRDRAMAFEARRCEAEAALGLPPNAADCAAPTMIANFFGTPADTVDCARRWVELARAAGDPYETIRGLSLLATGVSSTDIDGAVSVMQEAVAEARRLANPSELSYALTIFGSLLFQVDPIQAGPVLEDAVRVGTTVGNHHAVGLAYTLQAGVHFVQGDQREALRISLVANDLHLAVGARQFLGTSLGLSAGMLAAFGDYESAAVLRGAADAISAPTLGPVAEARAYVLAILGEHLDDDRLTELRARGATMADDEAVAYAREKSKAVEASWPADG